MLNAGYPFRYLLRMIDQKLSMVHSGEHLNVSVGVEKAQMFRLRFGHEGLFGSVPPSPCHKATLFGIHPAARRSNVNGKPASRNRSSGSKSRH